MYVQFTSSIHGVTFVLIFQLFWIAPIGFI